MNELNQILTKIEVLQNDLKYIREFIEENKKDHDKLNAEVGKIKVTLIDHIAKVKGFGILLGLVSATAALIRLMPI